MARFLGMYGFLAVVLRAAALVFQAFAIGGVVFRFVVLKREQAIAIQAVCDRFLRIAILALIATQSLSIVTNSAVLMATANLSWRQVAGATYSVSSLAALIASSIMLAFLRRSTRLASAGLLVSSAVLLVWAVTTSHAASRLEQRWLLSVLTGMHMLAAFVWIGGLPYLLLANAKSGDEKQAAVWTRRFSRLAVACVSLLLASALAISFRYVDSPKAIYGTAYGVMLAAKAVLLVLLLALGRLNYGIIRAFRTGEISRRLGRFVEAELGIGLTAILAAASLTSQPPAIDLKINRLSAYEIYERIRPRLPRLRTPSAQELSPSSRLKAKQGLAIRSFIPGAVVTHPNTPADIAWSEYNHNWIGVLVLAMGALALAARNVRVAWLRHWPLIFLALAVFILLRADPEAWPLGPDGFWESLDQAEIVLHRFFALIVAAFAVFEWRAQRDRPSARFSQYVFPSVCALAGALLLTHSHALGNIKEELLAELSHVPLAILGVIAGWSRWLELRLPPADRRIPALIWPTCFVAIGALLLNYREG